MPAKEFPVEYGANDILVSLPKQFLYIKGNTVNLKNTGADYLLNTTLEDEKVFIKSKAFYGIRGNIIYNCEQSPINPEVWLFNHKSTNAFNSLSGLDVNIHIPITIALTGNPYTIIEQDYLTGFSNN